MARFWFARVPVKACAVAVAPCLLSPAATGHALEDPDAAASVEGAAAVIETAAKAAGQDDALPVQPDVETRDSISTSVREGTVEITKDGAVRALTVINEPRAPTRYDYEINVAEGIVLEPTDDGAIAMIGRTERRRA